MKPEDQVTADRIIADRLTPAGTTQTPLTDAQVYTEDTGHNVMVEVVSPHFARQLERELTASKAREAELVKALKRIELELEKGNPAITDTVWMSDTPNETMLEAVQHSLTAPPNNSKEMNK